jgi:hypothetical protein
MYMQYTCKIVIDLEQLRCCVTQLSNPAHTLPSHARIHLYSVPPESYDHWTAIYGIVPVDTRFDLARSLARSWCSNSRIHGCAEKTAYALNLLEPIMLAATFRRLQPKVVSVWRTHYMPGGGGT